jgi:hypothetical protein
MRIVPPGGRSAIICEYRLTGMSTTAGPVPKVPPMKAAAAADSRENRLTLTAVIASCGRVASGRLRPGGPGAGAGCLTQQGWLPRSARPCGARPLRRRKRLPWGAFAADLPVDRALRRTGRVRLSAFGNSLETPTSDRWIFHKTTMCALRVTASHASQREPGQTELAKSTTYGH